MAEEQIIVITTGEDAEFDIYLTNTQGRPIDLTAYDEFKFCVPTDAGILTLTNVANANGSIIEKVAPDVLGHLKVTIDRLDTANLSQVYGQDFDIEWGITGGDRKRKKVAKALNVEGSLC